MSGFATKDFWITSDLHLGHPLISGKRGFSTTDAHDSTILGALYELPRGATFICLGDISVGKDKYALDMLLTLKYARDLTMVLTPGNHDKCHPKFGVKSMFKWTPRYQQVFDLVAPEFVLERQGRSLLFTHLPRLEDAHRSERLTRWIARDGFDCIIHGHTHSDVPIDGKHVNLCLEATNLRPIHSEELWDRVNQALQAADSR